MRDFLIVQRHHSFKTYRVSLMYHHSLFIVQNVTLYFVSLRSAMNLTFCSPMCKKKGVHTELCGLLLRQKCVKLGCGVCANSHMVIKYNKSVEIFMQKQWERIMQTRLFDTFNSWQSIHVTKQHYAIYTGHREGSSHTYVVHIFTKIQM